MTVGSCTASLHAHKHHREALLLDGLVIDSFELIASRFIGRRIILSRIVYIAQLDENFRGVGVAQRFGFDDVNRFRIEIAGTSHFCRDSIPVVRKTPFILRVIHPSKWKCRANFHETTNQASEDRWQQSSFRRRARRFVPSAPATEPPTRQRGRLRRTPQRSRYDRVLLNARQRAGSRAAPHRHRTAELKACR